MPARFLDSLAYCELPEGKRYYPHAPHDLTGDAERVQGAHVGTLLGSARTWMGAKKYRLQSSNHRDVATEKWIMF